MAEEKEKEKEVLTNVSLPFWLWEHLKIKGIRENKSFKTLITNILVDSYNSNKTKTI